MRSEIIGDLVGVRKGVRQEGPLKPNSLTHNFVRASDHNLESSQLKVSVYNVYINKPVSNNFGSREGVE
jgi:hypothetical protein